MKPSSLLRKADAEKDETRDRPGCEPKEAESEEAEAEEEDGEEEGKYKDPSPCSPRDKSGSEASAEEEEEGSKNPIRLLCDGEGCTAAFPSLSSSSLSMLSVSPAEVCGEFATTAVTATAVVRARRCRSERSWSNAV